MNKSTRFELRENQEIMSLLSTIYDFDDGDGLKLTTLLLTMFTRVLQWAAAICKECWHSVHHPWSFIRIVTIDAPNILPEDTYVKILLPFLALKPTFYQTKVFSQTYGTIILEISKATDIFRNKRNLQKDFLNQWNWEYLFK